MRSGSGPVARGTTAACRNPARFGTLWEMQEAFDALEVAEMRRRALVIGARVRACVAVGAFAAGLLIARQWGLGGLGSSALWFGLTGVGLLVAALARGRAVRVALVASTMAAGSGWYTLRVREVPAQSLMRLVAADDALAAAGVPVVFEGIALDEPRTIETRPIGTPGSAKQRSTRFEMAVETVRAEAGPRPAAGTVRLVVFDAVTGVYAGDRIRARGLFLPVRGPQNAGEVDPSAVAIMEGRVGVLEVDSGALVGVMPDAAASHAVLASLFRRAERAWLRGLAALRSAASAWLAPALEADAGGDALERHEARAMLGALLIGQEDSSLVAVNERFARLGVVHVLSISGFHLVVMTGVVLACVRLTGDRGIGEPLIAGTFVVLYMLVVPAGAPILRSGIMVLALLAAELAGKRYDRLTILLWAALIVLVWRPLDLWSAGAQLSFGITGALIGLGTRFHARLFGVPLRGLVSNRSTLALVARGTWRWLLAGLSTSLLCWAVGVPVVLYHMGLVSPFAAISSTLLVPLFSLLLVVGFVAIALGAISSAAAALSGSVLVWLAHIANAVGSWLDGLPGMALYLPAVSVAWTIAATAALVWWCGWARVRSARAWWVAAAVLAWLAVELIVPLRGTGPGTRLDAFAIGDGSAVLIRGGRDALLWGGSSRQVSLARRAVPRAARALGAWPVERIVISTAAPADVLALPALIRPLGVREVLVCPDLYDMWRSQPAHAQSQALAAAVAQGATITRLDPGARVHIGSCDLSLVPADDHGGTLAGTLCEAGKPLAVLSNSQRGCEAAAESVAPLSAPLPLLVLGPGAGSRADASRLGDVYRAEAVWWSVGARAAGVGGAASAAASGARLHAMGLHGAATAHFAPHATPGESPTASSPR